MALAGAARGGSSVPRTPSAHHAPPTAHRPPLTSHRQLGDVEPTLSRIAEYRITNGEILHGFVWQSLILLKKEQPWADPAEWVYRACGPVWKFDGPPGGEGVNRGVCGHAAGHGFYYYYGDLRDALPACRRANGAGGQPEEFGEFWRTTCEGGCAAAVAATRHLLHLRHHLRHLHRHLRHLHRVYHSAFNSLSADEFRDIIRRGDAPSVWSTPPSGAYGAGGVLSITAALCKASAPGPCPVSLGADEAAGRLEIVRGGFCDWPWKSKLAGAQSPPPPPSPLPPFPEPPPPSPPPPPPPSTPASFSLRSDADAADQEFPLLGAIVGGALGGGVTIGATIVALVMVCKKAPTAQAAPQEVAAVPVVTAVEMRTVEGVRV